MKESVLSKSLNQTKRVLFVEAVLSALTTKTWQKKQVISKALRI
jgi:hypothetical protein